MIGAKVICLDSDFTELKAELGKVANLFQYPKCSKIYTVRGINNYGGLLFEEITNPHICINVLPLVTMEIGFNPNRFEAVEVWQPDILECLN